MADLRRSLRRTLSRNGVDEHDADDIIQETCLRAARYRANLNEDRRLRPWATKIALNVLSDRKKRDGRYVQTVAAEGGPEPDWAQERQEDEVEPLFRMGRWELREGTAKSLLREGMGALREDDRRLLGSFYGGGESCRKTASDCDIPDHLVKVRLFRARRRLARLIRRRLALGEAGS